jgi:sugar lactone lactonase YvrE
LTEPSEVEVLVPNAGELSEGPCWDNRTARLIWVDILAGRVHAIDPATGLRQMWEIGMPVGAVVPRSSGGWVAAVERGFAFYDDDWRPVGPVISAPEQPPRTRFNDGRCDPAGRFWAGTLGYDESPGVGSLYCLGVDHVPRRCLTGVTISNGLGWSADGSAMYFVDSGTGNIDTLRFDLASGTAYERRTLVAIPPSLGVPDGLTVDADGFLWVAVWGGGCVRRYSPTGRLERSIDLPATQVSSLAFGGPHYSELFITTAAEGLDHRARAGQPLAGSVFRHHPGVVGRPPTMFAA